MKTLKKNKNELSIAFSLSPSGISSIIITIIVFSLGYVRGELFVLLTGVAFLSYGFLSLIFSIINIFLWKKIVVSLTEISSDTGKLNYSKKYAMTDFFGLFTKVIFFVAYNALTEKGNLTNKWYYFSNPLLIKNDAHINFTRESLARGVYSPQKSEIRIIDPANFFIFHIMQDKNSFPLPFVICPEPEEPVSFNLILGQSIQNHGKSTFNRSEDLYENRTYVPGDDPRKINWKIFSHTGVLALREGELLPPPKTEYTFIFNTVDTKFFPKSQKHLFDILVNRATSIALSLGNRKIPFTIGSEKTVFFSTFDKNTVLSFFSFPQLETTDESFKIQKNAHEQSICLFFMLPGEIPEQHLKVFKKDHVLICIGPVFQNEKNKKLINERYRSELENTVLRLKKEGYHVSTV